MPLIAPDEVMGWWEAGTTSKGVYGGWDSSRQGPFRNPLTGKWI